MAGLLSAARWRVPGHFPIHRSWPGNLDGRTAIRRLQMTSTLLRSQGGRTARDRFCQTLTNRERVYSWNQVHTGGTLSDSDKFRIFSAAARPIRMQSGMPIPWYALPATYRPGICARRASSSAWRAGCPTVYCAMERGQRAMRVKRGGAVTPAISRSSWVTAAVTASSLSPNTPASSMPPRKQRATTLPAGTRYGNLVPTQVQATNRRRSFLGTRNPKPEGGLSKSASFVYLFAVSDARDIHRLARVINGIHDAVIPRANPPAVLVAMQLLAAGGTRISGEFADLRQQPRDRVRRQTRQLLSGGGRERDEV